MAGAGRSTMASDSASLGVDIGALSTRLRFVPQDGCIWLEGERMVLLHQAALSSLRRELIDTVGTDAARGILARLGQVSGATDAALARRAKPDAELSETFLAGPRLHAIEGIAASDPVGYSIDDVTKFYVGEWTWRNSVEVEAHLDAFGQSAEPVCWMALGYASAYTSAFMGRPILYREVECRATGAPQCRIVGKPAELWEEETGNDLYQGLNLADDGDAPNWANLASGGGASDAGGDRLVGSSPGLRSAVTMMEKVARTRAPVLLIGEPGVGKKTAARALHRLSDRGSKRLVTFNCASLEGDQLDAELFGFERSAVAVAAAGASRGGRIERASGGTLFLEDVHRLDLRAQAKLLQVLQTDEVDRIGATHHRSVDVRIVASSSTYLGQAVGAGAFREDLYYRLAMFPVSIPPLRERRSDLPVLVRHFLNIFSARYGKQVTGISARAVGYLLTYDFPGNVAELESMIERAVIMAADGAQVDIDAIASTIDDGPRFLTVSAGGGLIPRGGPDDDARQRLALDDLLNSAFQLDTFERDLIERAVERAGGNLSRAAASLGLTRPQLAYRYRKGTTEAP